MFIKTELGACASTRQGVDENLYGGPNCSLITEERILGLRNCINSS